MSTPVHTGFPVEKGFMKLRLRHNSIRLRLLKGEVDSFRETGFVAEEIIFPDGRKFTYAIERNDAIERPEARLAESRVTILVPKADADVWTETDEVGIRYDIGCGNGIELRVVIEKDFVCIDRKDDPDNADAFPNPTAKC